MNFYGQFDPPFDKVLKERYFDKFDNGVGIECGSFDGITECNLKYFEENQNWKIYNIEASPPIFELLVKNRPDSKNFNIGLSNLQSEIIFKHALHPKFNEFFGNGSFKHLDSHYKNLISQGCSFKEYTIKTTTYNDFINQNKIDKVDCFVLDVEGYELEVIEGMKNCEVLPKIFMIEYPIIGLEKLIDKINETLPDKFSFDYKIHNSAFFILK